MRVLLSIRPEFAQKILDGQKRYEYRRRVFREPVDTVLIYSTMPEGRIVGEFKVGAILHCEVEELWVRTQDYAGVSHERFSDYFGDKQEGFALKIESVQVYDDPINPRQALEGFRPPQSFCYLSDGFLG